MTSLGCSLIALWCLAAKAPSAGDDPEPSPPTELWRVLEQVADEHGKAGEVQEVVEHLRNMVQTRKAYGRLSRVLDALANPWSLPRHSQELRDLLIQPFGAGQLAAGSKSAGRRRSSTKALPVDFVRLVPGIADWLDLDGFSDELLEDDELFAELWEPMTDPEVSEMELLECLSEYVASVHDFLDQEWAFSDAQRTQLFAGYVDFSEAWYRTHFPGISAEDSAMHKATQDAYQDLLFKARPRAVLRAAAALMRLADPEFQASLAKRLSRTKKERGSVEGFEGDIRVVVGLSDESRVVLGGKGKSRYSAPAALIIDLGGKDTYGRAAVVGADSSLVQVVIDLSGDDLYESEGAGPACAVGGVALLFDRRGNDRYVGGRHAQASSAAGFAMLVDLEGDDVYTAEDFGQAYALCGTALLYDCDGDDRYEAWAYTQGSGNGTGFSALVDRDGDDQYLADGHWPDVYGNSGPEIYHGAAQGFNLGFRSGSQRIAGGFSSLIDLAGKDRYQAGNFSQGGGYYFGFGLMYDGAGDDETFGSRYAQGFGVHQAVGIRWDAAGNDYSVARTAANIGSAWDEGVGFFIDDAGDDVYEAAGLALGGAAQTGVAIFLDRDGEDRYSSQGGAGTQGGAGASEYHEMQSVGFLLDLGGDADSYSRDGRADGVSLSTDWVGLFLDAKDRSVADRLAGTSRGGRRSR